MDPQISKIISVAADHATEIAEVFAFLALLIAPLRHVREGQKCLLRAEITRLYYRHADKRTLRQYEYENLEHCYRAYKALKGNSFIDRIYKEMQEWDIVN